MRKPLAAMCAFTLLTLVPAASAQATTRLCFKAGSQVEGAIATAYVGGAAARAKRATATATTYYKEALSFQPDRYWRFKRVYGPGISSTTVPATGYTYNRAATWYFEWNTSQGFVNGVSGCAVAN